MISGKVETEVTTYPFWFLTPFFVYRMAAGYHSPAAVSVHTRPSAKVCVIQKHKYWRLRGSRIDETNPRNGAKGSNPSAVSGSDGNACMVP